MPSCLEAEQIVDIPSRSLSQRTPIGWVTLIARHAILLAAEDVRHLALLPPLAQPDPVSITVRCWPELLAHVEIGEIWTARSATISGSAGGIELASACCYDSALPAISVWDRIDEPLPLLLAQPSFAAPGCFSLLVCRTLSAGRGVPGLRL